ncbi:MAG: V-type ATP synthase subunit F [Candidatus Diapherotrites archaeon CG08_land_8_20_14_0_20_34_12]|nr:MAG: V-type ATP synthase subunit F [Candidatus Diapherotrites archaeon CG08_land_8_20_14_0_20_34_12]
MQIAIVGSDDFITGFRLAGIKALYETNGQDIDRKMQGMIEIEDIGIIVLREEDYQKVGLATKRKLEKMVSPVIITLAGEEKSSLRELIKRSIGVDLWKEK